MSYILKALRLSEEERAKGDVPRLTTRHERRAVPRPTSPKRGEHSITLIDKRSVTVPV